MTAVWRLNLLVSIIFISVLLVSLALQIQQASKDIQREVAASVSFTLRMLPVVEHDEYLLEPFLNGETRHVRLTVNQAWSPTHLSQSVNHDEEGHVPSWFLRFIPAVAELQEQFQLRFLPDGRELRIEANPLDEAEEVWETTQQIVLFFMLAILLSNVAIWWGVTQGLKPIAHFLQGLKAIEQGRLDARLETYHLPELNQVGAHFNKMAEALESTQQSNSFLTRELMTLQEKERATLARELHDDLGQYATGIKAQAYLISQTEHNVDLVKATADQIMANCSAMHESFRRLVQDLHPVILDQLALPDAVNTLAETWQQQHGIHCYVSIPNEFPVLSDEQNSHLFRFMQEALNNVARHADATQVDIRLCIAGDEITVWVGDNGKGLPPILKKGLGLRSMKERAAALGGFFEYANRPSQGVWLAVTVPLLEAHPVGVSK